MTANDSALLRYAMILFLQKLTQVMKSIQQDTKKYRDITGKY